MFYKSLILLSILLFLGLSTPLPADEKQAKGPDDVVLEIMTVKVMVDRLEKMPRVTEDERNAWAKLFMDIEERFSKIVKYETKDNLNLWILIGRWAVAEGLEEKSPYASEPFFHIQRIRPDYQKDEELLHLMAKLNAIRNKEYQDIVVTRYNQFIYLFEKCDTNDSGIQLRIGQAYSSGGNGLWLNSTESVKWYKRAAAAGNADAIGELGDAYLHGYGDLKENEETGIRLLKEAVVKGSASAACKLGKYYQPDIAKIWNRKGDRKKAIEMYHIAAERGVTGAFAALADEYVKMGNGKEALRWANGGDEPNASDEMEHQRWEINRSIADNRGICSYIKGEVYAFGIGEIKQDLDLAKKLFEESYRKGNYRAAQILSAMYQEGIGVETNIVIAEQWKSNAVKAFSIASCDWHNLEIKAFAKKLRQVPTEQKTSN